jgi:hypothetical protein
MKLADLLGKHVSSILETSPFNNWQFERSVEMEIDRPCIGYVFLGKEVELLCDLDERVRTIFLHGNSPERVMFSDIPPFTATASEVRTLLGVPAKHGEESSSSILGKSGAWDRFNLGGNTIHVEYKCNIDGISKVTLMRNDVVPK